MPTRAREPHLVSSGVKPHVCVHCGGDDTRPSLHLPRPDGASQSVGAEPEGVRGERICCQRREEQELVLGFQVDMQHRVREGWR